MHDCEQTKEQMLDLAFGELEPGMNERMRVAIEGCPRCLAQYQAMTETLHAFDRVADAAMPDESYWPGYEARMQARLQQQGTSFYRRLLAWFGGLGEAAQLMARPMPLAAGLLLLLLIVGWWRSQPRQIVAPTPADETATLNATPQPTPESQRGELAHASQPEETGNDHGQIVGAHPRPYSKARLLVRTAPSEEVREEPVVAESRAPVVPVNSLFDPETTRHFEQAQLLLRSFRNTGRNAGRGTGSNASSASPEIAYEKQWSRRLLYQNILLRRDAEAKGNFPAETTLSDLEPVLLDIANLPDEPTVGEMAAIKERVQRRDLVAALQLYSAQPTWPTYQNQ